MKETNYWQQFMNTGSVDAYLNYRKEIGEGDNGREEKGMMSSVWNDSTLGHSNGIVSGRADDII